MTHWNDLKAYDSVLDVSVHYAIPVSCVVCCLCGDIG